MTTFTGEGITYFQACSIKGMISLNLKGLQGRARVRDILATAHSITGKGPYKTSRQSKEKALADLDAWIKERQE